MAKYWLLPGNFVSLHTVTINTLQKMRTTILSLILTVGLTAYGADYNIMDFGATSSLKANSTQALQNAIDRCSADGGGRVVVPAGQFRIGTIILRSNVNLHLEQGATLYGSTDLADYRRMKTSYVSLRTHTETIQLMYADSVENVVIDGYGTIDGQGRAFPKLSWNDEGITRPHLLRFIQCRNITIKDVTLRNSGCWMQHYLACDRLTIDGIKVFNRNNYNNDALDLDGCHDVIVRGMIADSDDDGITLKSTSPRLCENIRISDCVVSSHCNAVKLGTETNGGFRNVNISGIVVKPSEDQREKFFGQWIGSSAISLEIVDGGVMENVSVSDVTVEGTESPIFIRLGNRGRGYLSGGADMENIVPISHVGRIDGVRLDNIQIRHAGSMGCSITGLPDHPVRNVWLSNISIHHKSGVKAHEMAQIRDSVCDEKEKAYPEATMWGNLPAKGFFVRHAREVQFSNIQIQTELPDVRQDFVCEDTEGWGDQGDGTYRNPVLNADFSDPDVIRVGQKYYMVASDFHFLGMQVLESDDMVNWRYVSQIYRRFDEPGWDENAHYAGGSWAPAIRYHDGLFYVYFCTPDEGLYMSTAKRAEGPWSPLHLVKRVEKWEDPCPFWDDDGQAYLGRSRYGAGPIIVHRMSPDGRRLLDEGKTVYEGPVAEGTKFLKRNGWYYLIIPEGGVGQGWQTVLRSRNIYGPYERRVVLEQGSTRINGPHQGALVDAPDGSWWFYHFQETPVLGRVVHLQPVCWDGDWPLMGVDYDGNGIGEPVASWRKPILSGPIEMPQTDDDFTGLPGLQWQWNHNPDDDHWSTTERKGWLTLQAQPADGLMACRNMLTQKVIGWQSESTVMVEASGDNFAGLSCTGKQFRGIGLCRQGVFVETDGQRRMVREGRYARLWLRVTNNSLQNQHQFAFSTDGEHFVAVDEPFPMRSGYWKGIRVGLFCYGEGGKAHFNDFQQKVAH